MFHTEGGEWPFQSCPSFWWKHWGLGMILTLVFISRWWLFNFYDLIDLPNEIIIHSLYICWSHVWDIHKIVLYSIQHTIGKNDVCSFLLLITHSVLYLLHPSTPPPFSFHWPIVSLFMFFGIPSYFFLHLWKFTLLNLFNFLPSANLLLNIFFFLLFPTDNFSILLSPFPPFGVIIGVKKGGSC